MSTLYRTIQGDRLDMICKRHYGTERNRITEIVLSANQGLAAFGPLYNAGVSIFLPDISTTPVSTSIVRLWD
jgi:phage tail protein X